MHPSADIHLYHASGTRSDRVKLLLDMLGFEYDMTVIDQAKGDHKRAEYRKINPFGELPGLMMDGEPVVESAAQMMLIADLDPQQRFAPKVDDVARRKYVQWLTAVPTSLEPMVMPSFSPVPMPGAKKRLRAALEIQSGMFVGPYCIGDQLSAADIFLHWGTRIALKMGLLKGSPLWTDYVERLEAELAWDRLNPSAPGFLSSEKSA